MQVKVGSYIVEPANRATASGYAGWIFYYQIRDDKGKIVATVEDTNEEQVFNQAVKIAIQLFQGGSHVGPESQKG